MLNEYKKWNRYLHWHIETTLVIKTRFYEAIALRDLGSKKKYVEASMLFNNLIILSKQINVEISQRGILKGHILCFIIMLDR